MGDHRHAGRGSRHRPAPSDEEVVVTPSNTATQQKNPKPPNPPPVVKAGFEVWVLTKGGLKMNVPAYESRVLRPKSL